MESHVPPSDPTQFPGIYGGGADLQPARIPVSGDHPAVRGSESVQNRGYLEQPGQTTASK